MKNYYIIIVLIVVAAVLLIAWFVALGEHFKNVAAVCCGFMIGWLSAFIVARFIYRKKHDQLK